MPGSAKESSVKRCGLHNDAQFELITVLWALFVTIDTLAASLSSYTNMTVESCSFMSTSTVVCSYNIACSLHTQSFICCCCNVYSSSVLLEECP